MKKIYAFVLFMASTAAFAQAPAFLWADAIGDTSQQLTIRFVPDTSGNMYVAGHFTGTTDFDPGPATANLTSYGDSDIFVAKYTKNGDLLWNFHIGGIGPDECTGIVLHNDLIYITGYFSDTVDFDPIIGGTVLGSNGGKDIFIANFDTTGFLLFAHGIGGPNTDVASSIAVDDSGNIALTGSFQGNVDFDPGTGTTTLITGGIPSDAFIAKYSPLGALRWAFDFGSGTLADAGIDVAMDDSGNVYNVGIFQQTNIDFDPHPTNTAYLTSAGAYDAYIASYTRDGLYRWAFNIGGSVQDRCNAIAVDTANEVLITGRYSGSNIDFDPSPGGTAPLNAPGNSDIFVAKYTNSGGYLWAFPIGNAGNEEGLDITANVYNNYVIATGLFSGTSDFNPASLVHNMSASGGGDDIYVASYEPNGAFAWSFRIGGPGADMGTTLVSYLDVDSILLYVGGSFMDTVDFDPGAGVSDRASVGGRDIFIAQYRDPFIVGIPTVQAAGENFQVYPNPSSDRLNIRFDSPVRDCMVTMTDLQGKIVKREMAEGLTMTSDVSMLDAGLYFLVVENAKGISYSRFTVVR